MDAWTNLCRCCLSSNTKVSLLDNEQNIPEIFREVTTIEVNADDCLPQKLCDDCCSAMKLAHQFRKQCLKMESELKTQLQFLLNLTNSNALNIKELNNKELISDESMIKLESLIKQEPSDDEDDDCYYVLVIDDPKENEIVDDMIVTESQYDNIKIENDIEQNLNITTEIKPPLPTIFDNQTEKTFDVMDSFLIDDNRVPLNVPATILENEEEAQENDDLSEAMNIDESQESIYPNKDLPQLFTQSDMNPNDFNDTHVENDDTNNIIKILTTSNEDGTIVLKTSDGIQYMTDTAELVGNDEEGNQMAQEVILYDADDSSQFQILKYDGSELVIEYADESQIATVLQQEDGTFLCGCGEQFEDISDYEKHQHKHNPAGDHLCNMCGKGFDSPEVLTGHVLLHKLAEKVIKCPFCSEPIKRNFLTQHIKQRHNYKKPTCNICSKSFASSNNLKRHIMIHNGIKEFECDICFNRFHQKVTMQTHRLTHMNQYACNQCDRTFDNKDAVKVHKELDQCTKSEVTKVKDELLKTLKQEVTTNMGKLLGYACSLCKRMFSMESALEKHVEMSHIVDPEQLLCSECGLVLLSKQDMQIHIQAHKGPKYKKRFECSICGKSCSSQAMLIMHERVHTNERPFPCHLCSMRFKTKTHLRTHQLTHTREKKFGCSVCLKFFALKGNLVVHLRTHTGERPYVCTICEEAFIDSKYLKNHKLKKHNIKNVHWNKY